jgi:hypothetical protein
MSRAVEADFQRMGARAKVLMVSNTDVRTRHHGQYPPVRIDVVQDHLGPCFRIERRWSVTVNVAHIDAAGRHLLLIADHFRYGQERYSRFLCGHDERAWFVAAIPESAVATTVQAAKDALKPPEVWEAMRAYDVPMDQRDERWTHGFVRQGEWFFIPRPVMEVDGADILRNEPIRRGEGKPHWCEMLHRTGGETVWVCRAYPNGLTPKEYARLDPLERRRHWDWREMVRNAQVFVRGRISHSDHATIYLHEWHQVVMNTETKAAAMEHVAFLD